jgi:hypothetical protein
MLTADTATIHNPYTSNMTVYLKRNKPALGPLADSLDDLSTDSRGHRYGSTLAVSDAASCSTGARVARKICVLRDALEVGMDRVAKHSERDRRFAFKKRAAQVLLQPAYGHGQRRLRDAAASGCPRETALLADRQKIPNLMQLHHPLRIRCARTGGLPSDVGSGV